MINFRVFGIIFFPLIILFSIYIFLEFPENNLFFFSNFLIILFSLYGMFIKPLQLYSLSQVVFIFIFIFFGLVPLLNELDGNIIKGNEFNIFDKSKTNLIILSGILVFFYGSKINIYFFDRFINSLRDIKKLNVSFFFIFFLTTFVIFYKYNFNYSSIFFRETSGVFDSTIQYLIYTKFLLPMPIILSVIFYYIYLKNRELMSRHQKLKNIILIWFLFIFSIISIPPTGIPRFQAATIYIPFIIIFTKIWEKPFMMQTTFIAGIIVILPFLDKFRRQGIQDLGVVVDINYLKSSTFDSYQNFVRLIELDIISYGTQLMSSLLFFVPRSIWEGKAIASGTFLANKLSYAHSNISMPFIAEGYINFGIFGSILFMFLLGIIIGNVDRVAWQLKSSNKDCLFLYYYYFLFGLVFFLMRGDLINAIAFISGMTAAFWLLVIIIRFTSRLKI